MCAEDEARSRGYWGTAILAPNAASKVREASKTPRFPDNCCVVGLSIGHSQHTTV